MKYVRFLRAGDAQPAYGWLEDDAIFLVEGDPFGAHRRSATRVPMTEARLLAPLRPGKIICVGRNFVEHAKEHEAEVPDVPMLFMKPPSAVIGPGEEIVLPPQSALVEYEAELAVVIGRRTQCATPEDALSAVFGYTAANDVTARDLQRRDGQWTRAKGFDTFCPLGPWIETALDPSDVSIRSRVNGALRQMASSRDMVFPVPLLLAFISGIMTLEPGDLILTGTPAGVGPLAPGDRVQVEVEGIGVLENTVRRDEPA